jgi:hypothetical protein
MHVEPEQRRRAPRIRRPATGRFVRRSYFDKVPGDFQVLFDWVAQGMKP